MAHREAKTTWGELYKQTTVTADESNSLVERAAGVQSAEYKEEYRLAAV